jgi:predicted transposase/invertase (TIGR01784 family)
MTRHSSKEIKYMPISKGPMFYKIMHENKAICIKMLEIILGFEIEDLEYQNEEQVIETGLQSKGIRMDVYAKGSGKVYDIEMQNYASDSLPRRARYYQGAIDTNTLLKSRDYDSLPESFIIFICSLDLYEKGLAMYKINMICEEDNSIDTGFGEHFIFLNTKAYDNAKTLALKSLLEYIENGIVNDDDFVKQLDTLVKKANKDKAWVSNMWEGVTFEDTIRNEIHALKRVAKAAEQKAEAEKSAREAAESKAEQNNKLTDYLLDNDRIEDLKRCTKDPEFKRKLIEELGI